MSKDKQRLDLLLVERGLAQSREKAQALILSGDVLVNDEPVTKAGKTVGVEASIRIRGSEHSYVSRGALKLIGALDAFQVEVSGRTALDVGASTGGFTQVLLERGATRVFAVDVGHNQMDWKLRQDPRVVIHEKVNARYMEFSVINQTVDIIVVDVSFISLDKILPVLPQFMAPGADLITLIKPQFEVGKEKVGKGGIVGSEADRQAAVDHVSRVGESLGLERVSLIESPITGTQGNKEFLAHWKRVIAV